MADTGPEEKWVRVPIGFSPEVHEWLRETAHRRRTTMAQLVREAVREYRERQEPQMSLEVNGAEQ